jgi:hypothetical protein
MKFRRRPSPLLLLLLPSLATALSAAAQDNIKAAGTKNTPAVVDTSADPNPTSIVDLNSKPKYEIGTKDAPVDGKDGKPHAGPWVGTGDDPKKESKESKKAKEDTELVVPKKQDMKKLVDADGNKIPESNDGVMDDPHRQIPKEGTTGTEGGVSEKDKARKAHEGQTGEKLEKKPDSPKEAPPLPVSEKTKPKTEKEEKTKAKEADSEEAVDSELGGLEVNDLVRWRNSTNSTSRNRMTCQINQITYHIQYLVPQIKITSISRSLERKIHQNSLSRTRKAMRVLFSRFIRTYCRSP